MMMVKNKYGVGTWFFLKNRRVNVKRVSMNMWLIQWCLLYRYKRYQLGRTYWKHGLSFKVQC